MTDRMQSVHSPAEIGPMGDETPSVALTARHLRFALGLLVLALHPVRSAAQRYEPYLVENGAAHFVRPIDDSTVMSASARFAPLPTA